jgi:hypothetical protein
MAEADDELFQELVRDGQAYEESEQTKLKRKLIERGGQP